MKSDEGAERRESYRKSDRSVGRESRESEKSNRSKKSPVEVMINLYMNESGFEEKENKETNLMNF